MSNQAAKKFRKKPVVIEAMEITSDGWPDVCSWVNSGLPPEANSRCSPQGRGLAIRTLGGTMYGMIGDWVIKGVKGEFYPCKPDIFISTYEPVE